jgi:hypothetical protein
VVHQPGLNVFSGALGSELHDASSVMLSPLPRDVMLAQLSQR